MAEGLPTLTADTVQRIAWMAQIWPPDRVIRFENEDPANLAAGTSRAKARRDA
jgi:hypothetical protein